MRIVIILAPGVKFAQGIGCPMLVRGWFTDYGGPAWGVFCPAGFWLDFETELYQSQFWKKVFIKCLY